MGLSQLSDRFLSIIEQHVVDFPQVFSQLYPHPISQQSQYVLAQHHRHLSHEFPMDCLDPVQPHETFFDTLVGTRGK